MSATPLTPEQQAAVHTRDVSVALDAGAGCGKTFVLTERFLSHLEPRHLTGDGPRPAELHELIAITFTDAAAREMRQRIRRACRERLNAASGAEGEYWLHLLRSIDSARVDTIHGFCGGLLRSHAVELGLDPQFQLLDEGPTNVLRSEVTDQALRERLAQQEPVTMDLAARFDLTGLKGRLWGLLPQATRPEFRAWLERTPQEQIGAWRDAYLRDFLPIALDEIARAPQIASLRRLLPLASPVSPKFVEAYPQLMEIIDQFHDGNVAFDDLDTLIALARTHGRKPKEEWPTEETYEEYKSTCEKIRKLAGSIEPLADEEQLEAASVVGLQLARLAAEVADDYAAAKRERNVLDFDDLLVEARRLLTGEEFAPARARLQEQVGLLLVDEFQDTDRTQVDIVRAVVGAGLTTGRLFFVGDFKQSIYRFRGAEPGVFRELQQETPAAGRLPLATNFRSQPAVIDFVNTLFAPIFGEGYTALRAARPQVTEKPAIEFLWTPVPATGGSSKVFRDDLVRADARAIAQRIRDLIDSNKEIVGDRFVGDGDEAGEWRPRAVRPGDVAILFQAMTKVSEYEKALQDQGLPYHLAGGRAFYSQQEVYDVANLLRAVSSPSDEVALAGVLRSPFFSLLDETLYLVTKLEGGLAAGFATDRTPRGATDDEAAKLAHSRATLRRLRQQKGRASVAAILRDAIEQTGFDAVLLSEFLGERKLANLNKLIEQARSFDSLRPGDLDGFVRQLMEFVAGAPKEADAALRTGDADEVQLMTVHGAKGLEFPVVVLADLGRGDQAERSPVAFRPELGPLAKLDDQQDGAVYGIDLHRAIEKRGDRDESLRKFYVGCTRAADYLILSAAHQEPAPGQPRKVEGEWVKTLAERFDLETGRTLDGVDESPIVQVVTGQPRATDRDKERVNRTRLFERAVAAKPTAPPAWLAPVRIDGAALRRFSVSRLTGKLQHGAARPVTVDVSKALEDKKDEVDPRGLGTLVHAVLERLPMSPAEEVSVEQITAWSQSLAPLHLHRRVDEGAELAIDMVSRFVASERFAELRSAARVEREVEFLLRWPLDRPPGEGAYLQGYIDCLSFDAAGEAAVLDFKTNRTDSGGVQQAAEPYHLQLYVYALAVEQATGRAPRSLRLHFLRPGVEVDLNWDSKTRAAALDMVDQAIAAVRAEAVLSAESAQADGAFSVF